MHRIVTILLVAAAVVACAGPSASPIASSSPSDTYPIGGHAVAGPTCPVEPAVPVPGQCEHRPVAEATIVIADVNGNEVARVTTANDGSFATQLPAGSYLLTPQPVAGLMGGPPAISLAVSASEHPADLVIEYDTGIR